MKSIQEATMQMLAIKDYLELANDGAIIPYADVEKNTKVKMNEKGKQYLRSALRSLGREYACIIGYGIELESPENAINLVGHRLIKIDNAVKRGEKTANNVMKFMNDMSDTDKKKVLFCASVFGAIRASASIAKKEYIANKQKTSKLIALPEYE